MTNRLAQAQSLYLRKHGENPIDWWMWCEEALNTAKAENKPIFLSVGYSSCHWCTVMEGEAFSDAAIADYLNANFLPIKVDREERPDIDSIYMQALQMMTGQGGWPLNVFLSPDDLVPFYAGTYFPLEPRYGRPGFLEVLQALRNYYDQEKTDLQKRKAVILESLLNAAILETDGISEGEDQELFARGWETAVGIITPNQYGNSFPMMPYAQLALQGLRWQIPSQYDARQVCQQRGLDLALGGIFDHVAGGFHRYTVDPTWTVPHFEKMLYDNGQIIEYLANCWSAGIEEPAFKRAIAKTVEWLAREMTATDGYFYAAQDADSFASVNDDEPEEGAFYVWDWNELTKIIPLDELTELQQEFSVSASGNFEGKNVLQRRHAGYLSAVVESALGKLFIARYGRSTGDLPTFSPARDNNAAKTIAWSGRIPAVTDTKMIVAWNSLMISGLARSFAVFGEAVYLEFATKAAKFILDHQFVDGRFFRLNYDGKPNLLAQSEDYAFFIKALLDLHQAEIASATENANVWLKAACRLQSEFDRYLWSSELSGYFNTASDSSEDLIIRERNYQDNATPSANGIAIANLVRLALLTDDLSYLDRATAGLKAFRNLMQQSPQACPSLFIALDWYRNCTLVRTDTSHLSPLVGKYYPSTAFSQLFPLPSNSVGLVCQGLKCLPAAKDEQELIRQIEISYRRG